MQFHVQWKDKLPSTNAYLKEELRNAASPESGIVIVAREQTAGRGRSNRSWQTEPDTNLCFSVFLKTDCDLMDVPSSTMAAALGITDFLTEAGIPAAPKWPNDALVGNRKICGILSERIQEKQAAGIIVGIGLNVNMTQVQSDSIDRPATSMLIESGKPSDLFQTLDNLLPFLGRWLEKWNAGGFSNLRTIWTEKAGPIGKPLKVHDGDFYKEGTLAGFGPHGELLLQTEAGLETIWSGDIS